MFNNKKQITKIAIVMGSQSDYTVMKDCEKILKILKIKFETKIVSAHRTPDRMFNFAKTATKNKFSVIGVPIESKKLKGLDSLLSVCQMPSGVPVATVAIDSAFNAGLLAASIVSIFDSKARSNLNRWKKTQTNSVKKRPK